jgi:hypothetical protein
VGDEPTFGLRLDAIGEMGDEAFEFHGGAIVALFSWGGLITSVLPSPDARAVIPPRRRVFRINFFNCLSRAVSKPGNGLVLRVGAELSSTTLECARLRSQSGHKMRR